MDELENLTDDELQELGYKRCDICGEIWHEEDLIDTEGMINGGCGICCPDCVENGDIGRI